MSEKVDYVEVSRQAHELRARHERGAYQYAEKLAKKALADNDHQEHQFWKAVAAALQPR